MKEAAKTCAFLFYVRARDTSEVRQIPHTLDKPPGEIVICAINQAA